MKLPPEFFNCDSVKLAQKLLGKVLAVQNEKGVIRKTITETESYGINDTACHAYRGRTKRNDPLFSCGGTVYIYLCYGIHEILNISAGLDGEGQGVMLRAVDDIIGPGKVGKLLGIDRSFNYEYLPTSNRIWLEDAPEIPKDSIQFLKRIGIGYASQADQNKLWRFRIDSTK